MVTRLVAVVVVDLLEVIDVQDPDALVPAHAALDALATFGTAGQAAAGAHQAAGARRGRSRGVADGRRRAGDVTQLPSEEALAREVAKEARALEGRGVGARRKRQE